MHIILALEPEVSQKSDSIEKKMFLNWFKALERIPDATSENSVSLISAS